MWRTVLVSVMVVVSTNGALGEDVFPDLPDDVHALVSEIREMSAKHYHVHVPVPQDDFTDYLSKLKSLAELSSRDLQERIAVFVGSRVEANIIQMAVDYSKHPGRIEMLVTLYGGPAALDRLKTVAARNDLTASEKKVVEEAIRTANNSPVLSSVLTRPFPLFELHTTAEYRPAWEALLLAPRTKEMFFMMGHPEDIVISALFRIGDDKAVPVLVEDFRATCRPGVSQEEGRILQKQSLIIGTMGGFVGARALHGMLDCLKMYKERIGDQRPPTYQNKTLRDYFVRILVLDLPQYKGRPTRWLALLKGISLEELEPNDREVVETAIKELEMRDKKP